MLVLELPAEDEDLVLADSELGPDQVLGGVEDAIEAGPLLLGEDVGVVEDLCCLQVDASVEEDELAGDVGEDERVARGGRVGRGEWAPLAAEGVEGVEVAELRVVAAAAEHIDLVLVDRQPETIAGFWQVAVLPLLPLVALEVVGVH